MCAVGAGCDGDPCLRGSICRSVSAAPSTSQSATCCAAVYLSSSSFWEQVRTGPCLNIKTGLPRYRYYHYKDKTVVRPSYLYNGNSYTGKTTSLYSLTRYCAATSSQVKVPNVLRWCLRLFLSDRRRPIIDPTIFVIF